jgi:hypothetical protein
MKQDHSHDEGNVDVLAQENKIAIVVDPRLGKGQVANRTAVLATGLAAHHPEIIGGDLVTADGVNLPGFTKVPIAVLVAKNGASIPDLFAKGRELGCTALAFLSRAQGLRSYAEYAQSVASSNADSLDVDAFIVYGPRKRINKITGNLPMLR